MALGNSEKVISFNHCRCGRHSNVKPAHEKHFTSSHFCHCLPDSLTTPQPTCLINDWFSLKSYSLKWTWLLTCYYFTHDALASISCFSLGKFIYLLPLTSSLLTPLSPRISSCFMRSGMFTSCNIKEYIQIKDINAAYYFITAWPVTMRRHFKNHTSLGCFQSGTHGFMFSLCFFQAAWTWQIT